MFSRSTAPVHCASGKDSIGRLRRFWPISCSASAGVSNNETPRARIALLALVRSRALGLEDADLLVQAIRNLLIFINGRIIFLCL